MDLPGQIERNIRERGLLAGDAKILVAVSGGLDSMVLLHLFTVIGPTHGWKVAAAHFNHQLRGEESDADQELVRARANELGLPSYFGSGDVRAHAAAGGVSIEMAARELRYDFLIKTALDHGFGGIALAHHADDQVETFWLRLLRGDVGIGVAGMRWMRPARGSSPVQIIRPLLNIPKISLKAWADEQNITFREDSSNQSLEPLRNRLRLEVLPALSRYQPELRTITLRAAEIISGEKEFLASCARDWLRGTGQDFELLPCALRREIVRLQLLELGIKARFELVEALAGLKSSAVTVSPELRIRNGNGRIVLEPLEALNFGEETKEIGINVPGSVQFGGGEISWQRVPERGKPSPGTEYFDADAIGARVVLRHWRAGDRFQPSGLPGEVKLQDLFVNLKVPASERRLRAVGLNAKGEIFWVEGLRIGERFKVRRDSRNVLKWTWIRG